VTIDDLKSRVGAELYAQACREAWESAPGTGVREGKDQQQGRTWDALQKVVYEIDDDWSSLTDIEFVQFFCDLYRELPSYSLLANMSFIKMLATLDQSARAVFWGFAREMLSSPDPALADPMSYFMWCGPFEDENVEEAWKALVSPEGAAQPLLERVLDISGPVPFRLKSDLYARLIDEARWHPFIFRSLLHSAFDAYGRIDAPSAARLITRLQVPIEQDANAKRLLAKLAGSPN